MSKDLSLFLRRGAFAGAPRSHHSTAAIFFCAATSLLMLVTMCATVVTAQEEEDGAATAAAAVAADSAAQQFIPRIEKRYSMQLEELTPSQDEDGVRPTVVSVVEQSSLFLPLRKGPDGKYMRFPREGDPAWADVEDGALESHLTFNEDFDPIWYYVLRRRGFETLEWSGCGGKWRPEWSLSAAGAAAADDEATTEDEVASTPTAQRGVFAKLRHLLAHHVVCTFSSVSFCASSATRGPESQFQWAAQFISTLTSSPLSWTADTPRHIRPSGVLLPLHEQSGANRTSDSDWCSYHLIYHDTLCTQSVSPLLNGGRSGRGVQDGLPSGVFKAVVPSFDQFFATPFHHLLVSATQHRDEAAGTAEVRIRVRLSFVTIERGHFRALAALWKKELPRYAAQGRLNIYIGPGGVPPMLRKALPTESVVDGTVATAAASADDAEASAEAVQRQRLLAVQASSLMGQPEVQYLVRTHGKDHGYLTVMLQPALQSFSSADVAAALRRSTKGGEGGAVMEATLSDSALPLHEGDRLRMLLFFPLHLVRPKLYDMESLTGSAQIENVYTDESSNTLAVQVQMNVTATHLEAYRAAYARAVAGSAVALDLSGVLLARIRVTFGWASLKDMPRDANSLRIVPQPIVLIERPVSQPTDGESCAAVCRREAVGTGAVVDHERSIATTMKAMSASARKDAYGPSATHYCDTTDACCCPLWLRSFTVSGSTLPAPDPAMVFNVLSLGLVFSAMAAGTLTRMSRKLICRKEDLEEVLALEKVLDEDDTPIAAAPAAEKEKSS